MVGPSVGETVTTVADAVRDRGTVRVGKSEGVATRDGDGLAVEVGTGTCTGVGVLENVRTTAVTVRILDRVALAVAVIDDVAVVDAVLVGVGCGLPEGLADNVTLCVPCVGDGVGAESDADTLTLVVAYEVDGVAVAMDTERVDVAVGGMLGVSVAETTM
jgi:hypothetical protein